MEAHHAAASGRSYVCHDPVPSRVDAGLPPVEDRGGDQAELERQRLREQLLRLIVKNESRRIAPLSGQSPSGD
jgi:hypothetical protein